MDFSMQQARDNLKTVIQSEQMILALDFFLLRYVERKFPFLESLTVSAKTHNVVKSDLERLVRECVPEEFIKFRTKQSRKNFARGK